MGVCVCVFSSKFSRDFHKENFMEIGKERVRAGEWKLTSSERNKPTLFFEIKKLNLKF